jgi:hypothetical protein
MPVVPSVGIVMPSYKNGRFIRRAVASLFSQEWSNWQAVVVDDGSPEPLKEKKSLISSILRGSVTFGSPMAESHQLEITDGNSFRMMSTI